jgi:uncharacterized protein
MWSHGSFYWNELITRDAEKAKAFYKSSIGWSFDAMPMENSTYWVAKMADTPVGGIFTMSGAEFGGVPEQWLPYLAVDDVDARLKAAKAAGAKVLREPFEVPGVGRIAIIQDPGGAAIGWMTPVTAQ